MNTRAALIYTGVAFAIGACTQLVQVAASLANSGSLGISPSHWVISAAAGIVSAGVVAALPWLKAELPALPAPAGTGAEPPKLPPAA